MNTVFTEYVGTQQIDEMIKEADTNEDGTIEPDEFIQVLKMHRSNQSGNSWGKLKLYDKIGGEDGVAEVVDIFYAKLLKDPILRPFFRGKNL